jgi:hypothetical protein
MRLLLIDSMVEWVLEEEEDAISGGKGEESGDLMSLFNWTLSFGGGETLSISDSRGESANNEFYNTNINT